MFYKLLSGNVAGINFIEMAKAKEDLPIKLMISIYDKNSTDTNFQIYFNGVLMPKQFFR